MDHERRELFAADATCAIGENWRVLLITEMFADPCRELTETLDIGADGSSKMTDVELIVGASVDDDCVAAFQTFLPLYWGEMGSCDVIWIRGQIGAKGHEFVFNTNEHLLERVSFNFVNFKDH